MAGARPDRVTTGCCRSGWAASRRVNLLFRQIGAA
jgi:hypothetical protein